MTKSLIVLLAALFSFSVLASAFHHHADLNEYPSCIYCKLAKDISSTEHDIPSAIVFPEPLRHSFSSLSFEHFQFISCSLIKPRAPPACFLQERQIEMV